MVGVEWERKNNSDKKANVQDLLMIMHIINYRNYTICDS
jgi:hypothetical protein